MKANKTNLKKALKVCAKAHKIHFLDWGNEGQYGLQSQTVPVIADVQTICKAFYGHSEMVESAYGYTIVWLGSEFLPEVDEQTLRFALPSDTKL